MNDKLRSESKHISATLQSQIQIVNQVIHDDSEEWKHQIKSLEDELKKVKKDQLINRHEHQQAIERLAEKFYNAVNHTEKEIIDAAKTTEKNLKILHERILSESKNIKVTLHSNIGNVTKALHEDSKVWEQEIKSLKNDLMKVQKQETEETDRKLRVGLFFI